MKVLRQTLFLELNDSLSWIKPPIISFRLLIYVWTILSDNCIAYSRVFLAGIATDDNDRYRLIKFICGKPAHDYN